MSERDGPSILWVDPNRISVARYEDELTAWGANVCFTTDVDEFMRVAVDHSRTWNLFITEMVMPPGTVFNIHDPDLLGGMATGRVVIRELERMYPHTSRLLFTHWRDLVPDWNDNDRGLYALAKSDYRDPRRFVEMVGRMIK
ncbi:hypothetical protein KBD61_05375 [Patescibacteria group bacterium]|nr:hypothetical protein [Patescibacteria group bacterium]MBP9710421.1 hypothetical protein [Patescibacteria group bacterium]